MREDNSEKPSYAALKDLIHGAWETHEDLVTDAEGRLSFTGFRGGYRLQCGDRTASLQLDGDTASVLTLG